MGSQRGKRCFFLSEVVLVGLIIFVLNACGGGGGNASLGGDASTTDITPTAFTFTDQTGVVESTVITSAAITVMGINSSAAISITGGTYSVAGAAYTSSTGTVTNGQSVVVRHTSSASASTTTNTVLTIGGVNATFSSTTAGVTYSTANVYCDLSELTYNSDESVNTNSDYSWVCSTQNRLLSANGIPNHEVGTFPNANNPNTISVQNISETFTISPSVISNSGTFARIVAYALNGIKFDPGTAGRCNDAGSCSLAGGSSGSWSIEALGHDTFDFGDDMNHAHVQPTGAYHYHGIPERYLTKLAKGEAMTLVGWAADGFPVYARYGYSVADDSGSPIKIMEPTWRLKSSADAGRPSTKNTDGSPIPLGAFTQDYEYVEGLGDLDRCNGRSGVTPEFPRGIYYYVVTDSFPYASRCLRGVFAAEGPP